MEAAQSIKKQPKPNPSLWKRFWSEPWFAIATIILAAAILLFIVAPVCAVLLCNIGIGTDTLRLDNYKKFFRTSYYLEALGNSVLPAVITTIIVLFLCINIALYASRMKGFLSKAYRGIAALPL